MKKTNYTKRIEELKNQISDLEAKAKKEKRVEETRLKVLLGAAVLKINDPEMRTRCLSSLVASDQAWATERLKQREVTS